MNHPFPAPNPQAFYGATTEEDFETSMLTSYNELMLTFYNACSKIQIYLQNSQNLGLAQTN